MPTDDDTPGFPEEQDELLAAIQGIEDRVASFAATQELQLEDLRQLIEQVRLEQRQAETEIALYGEQATTCASEALARADEALQRLAALAAGTQAREGVGVAPASESEAAEPVTPAVPFQVSEQQLAMFVGQQELRLEEMRDLVEQSVGELEARGLASATEQAKRLEDLRQVVDHVHNELCRFDAELSARGDQSTAKADEALVRANETVQRLEATVAAVQAREGTAAEVLNRLSAGWESLSQAVREQEQRVGGSVAEQTQRLAELREGIDEVRRRQQQVEANAAARGDQAAAQASETLARANETVQRLEATVAAVQAREGAAAEVLNRLSAGWESLSQAVREQEQRVGGSVAEQTQRLAELREVIDEVRRQQQQVEVEASARTAQANEAIARADDAVQRVEKLAAAAQVRDTSTAGEPFRSQVDWQALLQSLHEIEQRVLNSMADQRAWLETLAERVDQVQQRQQQAEADLSASGAQATTQASKALLRADETLQRLEAMAAAAQAREGPTAELLNRLSAGWESLDQSVRQVEGRVAESATEQGRQLTALRELIDQVRRQQQQVEATAAARGDEATSQASEALARANDTLQRFGAMAAAAQAREEATAGALNRLSEGWESLQGSVRAVEERVAGSETAQGTRLGELRELIDGVCRQQQALEAEARTQAHDGLVRADEMEQRLGAVAAAAQAREEATAGALNRLSEGWEGLRGSVRAVEERVAGSETVQGTRLGELRELIDGVRRQQQQVAAEASARGTQATTDARDAVARAEEAVRRVETIAKSTQAHDLGTAALLRQLSTGWEALTDAVRSIEQEAAALAARQESDSAELRQRIDQVWSDEGPVADRIRAASQQAAARADDAVRRADAAQEHIDTLVAASQAHETDTKDRLGQLSRGWEALSGLVHEIEQRVAQVAGRQESGIEALRQFVDHAHDEQCQLVGEVRARGEETALRAAEALARADEAVDRIGTVAATAQAREAANTEMLSRLSAGWETLTSTVHEVEQRLAVRHEAGLEELRHLVDQVQRDQRQAAGEATLRGEQATARANEAVARADETLQRLEAVATASQAHQASITELLGRLSSGWDGVTDSVRAVEQRMAAVEADVEPLKGAVAARRAGGLGASMPSFPALASWLTLTAPGALLTLGLLALMLVAAPWLSGGVHVAARVRFVAAALLILHGVTASLVLRREGQWLAATAVVGLFAMDALGAGILLGADLRLTSPGVALCLAVLVMSLMAGGATVGTANLLVACAGIIAAQYGGLMPLVVSPAVSFPTTLSVEPSYANVPALASAGPAFATMLSVEPTYAGHMVLSFGSSAALFLPALAVALVAMCLGLGVNLLWAHKVRGAVDAERDAAHSPVVRT